MKTTSPTHPWLDFLQRPANRRAEVSIPSGLQPTVGSRCNPVGVGELFRRSPRVARSSPVLCSSGPKSEADLETTAEGGQPWAECWNPVGIRGNTSLRFIVTSIFAVLLLAPLAANTQIVNDSATNTLSNVSTN